MPKMKLAVLLYLRNKMLKSCRQIGLLACNSLVRVIVMVTVVCPSSVCTSTVVVSCGRR